ncbi:glycoside hydrolase family 2 TIM barrel-domain containing protein [Microbacterium sp. R86528]|uniref:glycoside hydrolase family 2 TIM barrel-domain containing protein n=1 Tax=Microbacterium sp. R86528 TaxID=3093864 RepID=UPI0037CCBD7F
MLPIVGAFRPWTDPAQVAIGRLPMTTRVVESGDISLDGEWNFRLFEHPQDITADAIGAPIGEGWGPIAVPGNWTLQGIRDLPHYTNIQMPFAGPPPALPARNPAGVYRRTFLAPVRDAGARVLLSIGGADSIHVVYLNGEFVGYGTDARLESVYDLSSTLRDGENDLAIAVIRFGAHSYIEDQDGWWMAGLHRPVSLMVRPSVSIADVWLDADWDADSGRGRLQVQAFASFTSIADGWAVRVQVSDAAQTPVADASAAVDVDHEITYQFTDFASKMDLAGLDVAPWSAEDPALYSCRIDLIDPAGVIVDSTTQRVGFRRVEIVGPDLMVNGRRVWIHGVNRHDHHPDRGSAVTVDDIRDDLVQMRRHNITAIRTSHYPNRPEFLELCDELGFYVVDEADIESHAYNWHVCDRPEYRQAWIERVARMVQRDRNHPSVIMWSLGNESGYGSNHDAAAGWVRRADPTRPLHYEDAIRTQGWIDGGRHATDVVCPMYPTVPEVAEYGRAVAEGRADRPFIMCEYSHAMGNANGSLADYWDAMHAWPGLQGGFIWEWKDHGLRHADAADDRLHYGGMFGDAPHDSNFIADGLVSAELEPHPAMTEVAWVYRPVATWRDGDTLVIESRRAFTDLGDLRARWVVSTGDEVTTGELEVPDVVPGSSVRVTLPDLVRATACGVFTVTWETRSTTWYAGVGHEVARDQMVIGRPVFNTNGGSSLPEHGVLAGPELQLWRAAVDNDGFKLMLERAAREAKGSPRLQRWLELGLDSGDPTNYVGYERNTADGIERHVVDVPAELAGLPRIGVRYELAPRFTRMRWYGRGPGENYADRNRGSMIGIWEADIDRLPYLVPQEYGLRTDVEWMELVDTATDERIRVETVGEPFAFSAIRHTATALYAAEHSADLCANERLILSLDAVHRGVGNGACGPEPHDEYEIGAGRYTLEYRIGG